VQAELKTILFIDPDIESYKSFFDHDWLQKLFKLVEGMPKSLSLVNDLYYYWGSLRHGIIRPEDRSLVQNYIHSLARDQWQNGEMLIRVAHPEQRYDFYQLVFPPGDSEDGRSPHRGVEHWTWLGPLLLEALQRDTPFIAPKIASLVSRRVDGEHPGMYTHQTSLELLTGLFNASSERVMQLIAGARDGSTGENREFLDQIVRSYRQDGLA